MKTGLALLSAATLLVAAPSACTLAAGPSLAIYQQGVGVVEETRVLPAVLTLGEVRLEVPERIVFDSLSVELPGTVLSQSFHFTPPSGILAASIGEEIEVLAPGGDYPRLLRGTLLSTGDYLVLRDERGQIQLVRQPLAITLPRLEGLALDPYVALRVDGESVAGAEATLVYETGGLSWSASYIATLDESETSLALGGTIALSNGCGWDFEEASVRLVAGEIRQVRESGDRLAFAMAAEAAFSESAAFEYHVYTLAQPIDLLDGTSVSLPYVASPSVAAKKTYTYDGARSSGVAVALEFVNDPAAGLGAPLPGGAVRVFQTSGQGTLLLGEALVKHTPVDEKVSLPVGSAFDLVGERVQLSRERIATSTYRETYRITLRNHKASVVTIAVVEHPDGAWDVLSSSVPFERVDASTLRFDIEVPAGGEAGVDYTVEYSF